MKNIIKIVSSKANENGLVILSDESKDSDGDIIRQDGWDLSRFDKGNPTMLMGHDYRAFPIGNWLDYQVKGKQLLGRPNFAKDQNPQGRIAHDMHRDGFLPAVSVSFQPLEWKELEGGGREYTKQELLEVSFVSVPANPNALSLALTKGVISPEDKALWEGLTEGLCPECQGKEKDPASLCNPCKAKVARREPVDKDKGAMELEAKSKEPEDDDSRELLRKLQILQGEGESKDSPLVIALKMFGTLHEKHQEALSEMPSLKEELEALRETGKKKDAANSPEAVILTLHGEKKTQGKDTIEVDPAKLEAAVKTAITQGMAESVASFVDIETGKKEA